MNRLPLDKNTSMIMAAGDEDDLNAIQANCSKFCILPPIEGSVQKVSELISDGFAKVQLQFSPLNSILVIEGGTRIGLLEIQEVVKKVVVPGIFFVGFGFNGFFEPLTIRAHLVVTGN